MKRKWVVRRCKSKIRWSARRGKGTPHVFDSWWQAINYACLMAEVDYIMEHLV